VHVEAVKVGRTGQTEGNTSGRHRETGQPVINRKGRQENPSVESIKAIKGQTGSEKKRLKGQAGVNRPGRQA
jgi:hypothetical protein